MMIAGGFVGAVVSARWSMPPPTLTIYPLPHHIPKYRDGATLRFAMVHDVIHERYPVHGKAYYEERNRLVRQALPDPATADAKDWPLVDDLAVGLDRLGQHAEAVALMRAKLRQQQAQGVVGEALYSSYANLGTFLILWQLDEGFADQTKAKERVRESIDLVHQSIAARPDAHFGREVWQAVLEEWLLAFLDDPRLLLQFDMVGNRLDAPIDPMGLRPLHHEDFSSWHFDAQSYAKGLRIHADTVNVRDRITRVGAEIDWPEVVATSHQEPVPFDEPTLGIIGMWRYGGGANPHFALALAEIMLRVGQRYIAWCAYERTAQFAAGIPEAVREAFIAHCRARQQVIESQLPPTEVAGLRPRFDSELKFGKQYQAAYQQYEAERIAAGDSIDDPQFYDAFHAEHGPIASPVGQEDQFVAEREVFVLPVPSVSFTLFCAGLFAFLTACGMALLNARDRRRAALTP